jgi:hypothetical protein
MKIALLLLALGFGYKIFADATKEQGGLKTLGRLIGIVMMVVSLIMGAVCMAYCAKGACGSGKLSRGSSACSYSK